MCVPLTSNCLLSLIHSPSQLGNDKIEQRLARVEGGGNGAASSSSSSSSSAAADKEGGGGGKEKESADDPQFVKDLLALHDKFIGVVNAEFCGNALFQKALKDAFVEVVNKDVGKFKNADLLSSFCDRILKTGSSEKLSDSETEEFLEKTVQMFSYLTDKDLFSEIYRNQLAKRLLNQRSASDEMERLMIGKLKLKCGSQFTAKMEGMLNDLAFGADTTRNFEEYVRNNDEARQSLGRLEFSVQVLTSGHWPTYKVIELNLPPIMMRCTQMFRHFHDQASTSHKRLQWAHSLGNATVKGTFGPKRTYDLQIATLQAVVLLAFNVDSTATGSASSAGSNAPKPFSSLLESLAMPEEALKRVLHSLSCGKFRVLKKISMATTGDAPAGDGEKEKSKDPIKTTDSFAFNDQFSCQMRKIRIPMASLEESHNRERVEEDRGIAIEAAIVRIMKARKTLAHQQLVGEVLTQLSFFKPDPKVIKRRIEALIDREYLERDAENSSNYRYLA